MKSPDLCRLFVDLNPNGGRPDAGEYLVSIGRRGGVGSVYQIIGTRAARRFRPDGSLRVHLECLRAPDMVPNVRITGLGRVAIVGVEGARVWWFRWYSRGPK